MTALWRPMSLSINTQLGFSSKCCHITCNALTWMLFTFAIQWFENIWKVGLARPETFFSVQLKTFGMNLISKCMRRHTTLKIKKKKAELVTVLKAKLWRILEVIKKKKLRDNYMKSRYYQLRSKILAHVNGFPVNICSQICKYKN